MTVFAPTHNKHGLDTGVTPFGRKLWIHSQLGTKPIEDSSLWVAGALRRTSASRVLYDLFRSPNGISDKHLIRELWANSEPATIMANLLLRR